MNKEQLEQMSDFEINKIIYELEGLEPTEVDLTIEKTCRLLRESGQELKMALGANDNAYYGKDYCNNANDMWPFILDSKITISPIQPYLEEHDEYEWFAGSDTSIDIWHTNPLRAAAIVYILMQEK